MKTITFEGVLDLLSKGYTRTNQGTLYKPELKNSIQDHYDLERWEVDEMFKHPELKGRKTIVKKQVSFTLVSEKDIEPQNQEVENTFRSLA